MIRPTEALRSLIDAGTPFMAADCYSALTGRIIEQAGFDAAYMGGHATSMMHYAIPDCGIFTPTEMIDQAGRVADALTIPLIVDADQAGETVADVFRSVRVTNSAGVAGVHIEDEVPPKHSSWDGPLLPIADMQARIAAAAEARTDPAFVLIARCDELYKDGGGGAGSLDEAIRRGIAYAEAGADLYPSHLRDPGGSDSHRRRGSDPDRRLRLASRRPAHRIVDRLGRRRGGTVAPTVGRISASAWGAAA